MAHTNDHGDIVADGLDSRTGRGGLWLLKSTEVTATVLTHPAIERLWHRSTTISSAAQSVTVTDTSPNAVTITDIALRGTAPKQFAFTDDCGQSLAGLTICTIKVTFKPTTKGAKSAFLDVNGGVVDCARLRLWARVPAQEVILGSGVGTEKQNQPAATSLTHSTS